ncbi:MAG: hypothetical protein KC517_11745 [Bacteroidetes bacterium]|nr:hypothetical protein [Bacteroidota bacterium]
MGAFSAFSQTSPPLHNIATHIVAVEIPAVSLVNVIGTQNVNLTFNNPTEAGTGLSNTISDSSFWLNYSFIKGSGTRPYNHVYAKIINGSVPLGTRLSVCAKPYQGSGLGTFGSPTGKVLLNYNEARVVENISSCFTGVGPGNGHQLVYQLSLLPNTYHLLNYEESQQLSVLYTISE